MWLTLIKIHYNIIRFFDKEGNSLTQNLTVSLIDMVVQR